MTYRPNQFLPRMNDPAKEQVSANYTDAITSAVTDAAFRQAMQSVLTMSNSAVILRQIAQHLNRTADEMDAQARKLDSTARGAREAS